MPAAPADQSTVAGASYAPSTTHWRRGSIDGVTNSLGTRLLHVDTGAELLVRNGRLVTGAQYVGADRLVRRELARMGAMFRLRERGLYHVHAAAVVGLDGRAWALTGDSGSGKSTLTYALARRGWRVLGDDGVLVDPSGRAVRLRAWREPMRVSIELGEWFPELRERQDAVDWSDPRHRVPVQATIAREAPLAGLIVVRRGERDVLRPLAPTEALASLIRQSALVLVADAHAPAHLAALQACASQVPCVELEHTSRQLQAMPATMDEISGAVG